MGRIYATEVVLQAMISDFRNGARQFDSGWAGPDDDERQPSLPFLRIIGPLGRFECQENTPPDLGGIFNRL